MGEVFEAVQEVPIRRTVALKIIKPGMDTRAVIAQFERERQALALMDHPNIAKVLDAGATENGRPYFVMEFVDGVAITDYCDRHQLSVVERLGLFIQACQAIQHAHQKGIIHCDLKPSNVLVKEDEAGRPVPKVIDFGIAKATVNQRLDDQTRITSSFLFAATPGYMSPEQAGGGRDIDTRSDIYSLGVLLYELLAGQPAFDREHLQKKASDEILRIVREQDPPQPSARLTTLAAEQLMAAALNRRIEPDKLSGLIRGDLDCIVMRALEKDRDRRYSTITGLAADIQRYLVNEPVLARRPSQLYRLRKAIRRNRVTAIATAVIVLTFIAGFTTSTWEAVRATRAKRESDQIAAFLQRMLKGVGPSKAKGRDTQMLREVLDQTAISVGKDLKDQPEVEAELRSTIGGVYQALGEYTQAETMYRTALALRKKVNSESLKVADSLSDLANVFYKQGKLRQSETMHREALAVRRRRLGEKSVKVADSLGNLANVLMNQSQLPEAEFMQRKALALRTELLGTNHDDTAMSLGNLAIVLSLEGKLAESEAMQRESLAVTRRALGDENPDVAIALNDLADMLLAAGKLGEAEATNRVALALRLKILGNEHPDVAFSLFNLANVLAAEGRLPEAEAMNRRALAMRQKLLGQEHPDVAGSLNNLAGNLIQENKFSEAEAAQREALAIQRKLLPADHQDIAMSLGNLAAVLNCQGRLSESEATFRQVLAMQHKLLGEAHPEIAMTLHNLAGLFLAEHKPLEAEATFREALGMRRKLLPKEHPELAASLNGLASVLQEQGKLPEAEVLLREALAMRKKLLPPEHPAVAETLGDLAEVLGRENKLAEAEPMGREGLVLREKILPDDWQTYHARCRLGDILVGAKAFPEAERLLFSGYKGMKAREATIPVPNRSRLQEAIRSIVRLYEATNRSESAAEWRKRLEKTSG